jgi:hypothetical protein
LQPSQKNPAVNSGALPDLRLPTPRENSRSFQQGVSEESGKVLRFAKMVDIVDGGQESKELVQIQEGTVQDCVREEVRPIKSEIENYELAKYDFRKYVCS